MIPGQKRFPSVTQDQEIKVHVMSWHALFCRLFGHSGACSACGQSIPASEMVMRAQGNVYHLKVIVCMWSLHNEHEHITVCASINELMLVT